MSMIRGWAMPLLLLVSGCADLTSAAERRPSFVDLEQDSVLTSEGETIRLGFTVLDQDEKPFASLPRWLEPSWTSSHPQRLQIEGASLRATAPGEVMATVTVAGLSQTAVIRVNPRQLHLRVAGVYLTQSVQRFDGSVPLVAGRDALVRVFLSGDQPNFFGPRVRVHLYRESTLVHTLDLAPEGSSVPQEVDEGSFTGSWNALVPGALVQPGLSLVVEADPEGVVPLAAGSQLRFPASGTRVLDVRRVPKLWLRMIPVHQTLARTTGNIHTGNVQAFARALESRFPIDSLDVDLRTPYATDARLVDGFEGWVQLLREIEALRDTDGSARYYYGVLTTVPGSRIAGLGYVGWPAAIGIDHPEHAAETFAHELGHNFGLPHAPCGNPSGVDPEFPYAQGSIGVFGYDLAGQVLKSPETQKDLMSYCDPAWISDYNYEKVLAFRDEWDWNGTGPDRVGAREPALLVWGGVQQGRLVLEPAFELDMPPDLPRSGGSYRVEGHDDRGVRLFSYAFDPPAVDHWTGARAFSFAIPARLAQTDRLARLTLAGPEGVVRRERVLATGRPALAQQRRGAEVALSWAGEYPMALVRDARTGEVLSIARGGAARVGSASRELEVLLSDGVRSVRSVVRAP